jgi:diguanylate cyclase (GGDEF)-like protein/PAS domain S-box-containing protein
VPADESPKTREDPGSDTFRRLLEQSPVGIIVHVDGTIEFANEEAARILGGESPENLEGRSVFEFVPAEDEEEAAGRLERTDKRREPLDPREYHARRLDGGRQWVEARSLPVVYGGRPAVETVIQNVSERKRTERSLERTEHRYRQFVERVRDPVYVTDEDGRFLHVNPAFLETFGYDREGIGNLRAHDLYADPDRRDDFERAIAERGAVDGFRVRLRRSDGRELIAELSTVAVRDDRGFRYEGIIRDVTEESEAREVWERRALHDDLTGLPNRRLFVDRLEKAIERADRRGGLLAVLFMDLDDFKAINDRYGHRQGDRVLREAAGRMQEALRDEDTVARYGGDEFAALLERLEGPANLESAVGRLRERVAQVDRRPDGDSPLTLSVGTAVYDPAGREGGGSALERAREFIDEADEAMYREKRGPEELSVRQTKPRGTDRRERRNQGRSTPAAVRAPDRLEALRRTGLLDSDPEPSFDRLTELAADVLNAPLALVSLVDENRQFFKACVGLPEPWASEREAPLSHTYCQYVVDRGEPLVIEDARSHPLVAGSAAVKELAAIAYLGIPLVGKQGHVLGSFCVIDTEPRAWAVEHVERLRTLGRAMESEIELRLLSERDERAERRTARG